MEDNFDDDENDFQWLIDGDENILDVDYADVDSSGTIQPGISFIVGDDNSGFEVVFTQSDLERMLEIVKDNS